MVLQVHEMKRVIHGIDKKMNRILKMMTSTSMEGGRCTKVSAHLHVKNTLYIYTCKIFCWQENDISDDRFIVSTRAEKVYFILMQMKCLIFCVHTV